MTAPCFAPSADNYDRMMGRYLPTLAPAFADAVNIRAGMRVLDVGSGPGGLTGELVHRCGADRVAAVDPTPPFVQACQRRHPGVDVRRASAETLPYADASFDAALASLVVGFMQDPVAGIGEMTRVTFDGGTVAACFWDHDRMPALGLFWQAARTLDESITGEAPRLGTAPGDLPALLNEAGLADVQNGTLSARADYAGFDDFWGAYAAGVGPIGTYYQSLENDHCDALRAECRRLLGDPHGPFRLEATAWYAKGTVDR